MINHYHLIKGVPLQGVGVLDTIEHHMFDILLGNCDILDLLMD